MSETPPSHKNTKFHNHKVLVEDLVQTHTGSVIVASVSVSAYEPCLVNSVGCVLLALDPSDFLNSFSSPVEFP